MLLKLMKNDDENNENDENLEHEEGDYASNIDHVSDKKMRFSIPLGFWKET